MLHLLLLLLQMQSNGDHELHTLACYRSRDLVDHPRDIFNGVLFAQKLYDLWKDAVRLINEVPYHLGGDKIGVGVRMWRDLMFATR